MPHPQTVSQWQDIAPVIAPSMLKCDFGHMSEDVRALEAGGAPILHMDVMDGHFVPNLSYGALVIERFRDLTDLPFEAHLMISDPAQYAPDYLKAGCQIVTFHIETVAAPANVSAKIRDSGGLAGIAINPPTPVEALEPAVGHADVVLVMSVNPGFGGQSFIPDVLEKVPRIRDMFGPDVLISIDGGIAEDTISEAAAAGCELFVVGSGIFNEDDFGSAISGLRQKAGGALTQ